MRYKNYILLVLAFIFTACSNTSTPKPMQSYEKAFEAEDRLIILALRAEQLKDNESAYKVFDILYEKSNKKEYLYRSLQNSLIAKKFKITLDKIQNHQEDLKLMRIKVITLVNLLRLEEAEQLALDLVKKSKDINDYLLVADVFVSQKKFGVAVKYLESAYIKDYNEKILDRISIILYINLNRKKEAIAQLETHSRIHSCSLVICNRLVSLYSDRNDIDGLLSAYLRLYKINSAEEIATKIVQIYSYKKEYLKLIDFLKETKINDEILLQLYVKIKNYDKASTLAFILYNDTGDIEYLGQSAIYEYESKKDVLDTNTLSKIASKFEKVVAQNSKTLYLNYYGYLLIDHEIDVKKGLKYINKALEIAPNSSFYLDSLAWGYFKLNNCKKAKSIMNRVILLDGGRDDEILSHIESIDECLKNKGK
ncbi:MAG: hypothetical protein U9N02_02425 [Campylobacterota bacterium]|nr:hypothetical protein [Campylobacterota bacterium]